MFSSLLYKRLFLVILLILNKIRYQAECNPGFRLKGPETVQCGDDGTYSAPNSAEVTCDRIRCPNLSKPENGDIKIDSGAEYVGSVAQLSCQDGFAIWDEDGTKQKTITCQENGTWDGNLNALCYETPKCKVPDPNVWNCALNNRNRVNYCVTTCNVTQGRYLYQRNKGTQEYERMVETSELESRCTKEKWDSYMTENWQPYDIACIQTCPSLKELKFGPAINGEEDCEHSQAIPFSAGSKCQLSCSDESAEISIKDIRCLDSGKWDFEMSDLECSEAKIEGNPLPSSNPIESSS